MPIYEYRCAACGFQNEYLQRMSDVPLTDCPQCGKPRFKKMVTAAGFQLKGSGWYATDFKNSGAKPRKDADKPSEGAKKEESKTESKPEAKPDAACGAGACPACS